MQFKNNAIIFSPSDLITFMDSKFASHMERSCVEDNSYRNLIDPEDPLLKNLQNKGFQHEDTFLNSLMNEDKNVFIIEGNNTKDKLNKTKKVMRQGVDIISQAYLKFNDFEGVADFLIKVSGQSLLGDYHYEVWDTKLSKKMKPYFAIQLCCYAEMLENIQGLKPEKVAVVLGDKKISFLKVKNYYSYYKTLKSNFLSYHKDWKIENQPDPSETSTNGRWSQYAERILTKRRHLSLIANVTKSQINKLENAGIKTIDDIVNPTIKKVSKLNTSIFNRLKTQAELQISSEGKPKPNFKICPHNNLTPTGLSLLPPHSDLDIFFDIEGFPHIEGGLEYLWGATYFNTIGNREFKDFWAHDVKQEKQAFSDFVDWAFERWLKDPSMHIYHYASYEVTALRRLMGRYGIREHKVDTLLRNEVFVDLYNVLRNGVLIGEPSYSIKNVERVYRENRKTEVSSGVESIVFYEEWRSKPDGFTWQSSEVLNAIRNYNIDDCNSTQELAEWLRKQQVSNKIKYLKYSSNDKEINDEEENEFTKLRENLLNMSSIESDKKKKCD